MVVDHKYKMQAAPPDAAPMVVSTIQTPQRKEHYMSKVVLGLSVSQIIIGALCILLQIILICIKSPVHYVGQGIWTGLFFVLTGSFGIVSSSTKTACFIVAFLVLAIISAVIAIGILMVSPREIVYSYECYNPHYSFYGCAASNAVNGINGLMIVLAVVQAVVAIISSAFGCHGLCGGNRNHPMVVAGQVQYVEGPDGQKQMVILPFNQQQPGLPAEPSFNPVQADLPGYNQTPSPTYERDTKLLIHE